MSAEIKLEEKINLKKDFPVPSFDEWKKQVESDLKGESFEKKLVTKTYEGIDLQPIYTSNDIKDIPFLNNYPSFENFVRGTKASGYHSSAWEIAQEYSYALPEELNEALKHDLQRGLESININLDLPTQLGIDADQSKPGEVGKGGLSISGIRKMQVLFDNIDLTKHPIHINAGFSALPFTLLYAAFTRELRLSLMNLKGSITSDPYDFLLKHGFLPYSFKQIFDEIKFSTQLMIRSNSPIRTIGVSGLNYNNAGANAVQELAFVFATAVEYLEEMLNRGLAIEEVVKRFKFTFGISSFYFMEIAKLRAARILWNNILKQYNVSEDNRKIYIHGKTSQYNQTIIDPYVNMLRTTTEAFSAVVGGVDALTTSPFDEVFDIPDNFSRRIARNTQIILKEESHLDQVIDPAAGSFFVESLTAQLAESAWKLFQQIDESGGMFKAIETGFIQDEVNKVAEARKKDFAKRKSVLVGTNMYANPKEELNEPKSPDYELIYKKRVEYIQKYRISGDDQKHKNILDKLQIIADTKSYDLVEAAIEAYIDGAAIGEVASSIRSTGKEEIKVNALEIHRASEIFEELRFASENFRKKYGHKPKVFLAVMGTLKQYKARADFSRGFFEVCGFEIIYPSQGFKTTDEAVDAAINSSAEIITICSTDETYPELVPLLARKIKEKSPESILVLAGYPKDQIEQHKQSGIDEFIYLGADVQKVLSTLLNKTLKLN
ncbi:methylmalonyl-CoA mutase family protein [Ignavibacterium sp.]|uniref:methylmalonyl-CoA mutase family protein n=1 Tax=Ignavibacterium sp. TaxID=2651167 RepID=UPI002203DF89|nr:methylmalonyl-CoA mutase family protein [Ignavibacterium sp.]BDQ02740.1 MAG: methylmalonyl-CoA mutase [Ignavibacterium sp.]